MSLTTKLEITTTEFSGVTESEVIQGSYDTTAIVDQAKLLFNIGYAIDLDEDKMGFTATTDMVVAAGEEENLPLDGPLVRMVRWRIIEWRE